MGYRGSTILIPCDKGGLTYNKNSDLIEPQMMVAGTKNITLHEGGRRKRGGTEKVNTTAITGAPRIMGGFDFRLLLSSFQVVLCDDGQLYKNPTTVLKSGLSETKYASFDVFDDELLFCDGATTPQTWDGVAGSTSDLTTPAADWGGANQPFQVIAHGRGESRRAWYLLKKSAYYSSLDNAKQVAGGTSGRISVITANEELVAGAEFQDRLFLFTKTQAYLVDDADPDTANWGYSKAAWTGGAAHWRTIVKTPNDLIVMAEDGDIYSIAAVQAYGDYKLASLTRPAFIDAYIRDNVDLSKIDQFHAVYDPIMRACKFFVVRLGQTVVDTALVLYIDRPTGIAESWTIHEGALATSGYNASCSFLVRTSPGVYTVYTGDYAGTLWKLERSTRSDNGLPYYGGFKLPTLTMANPRTHKHFKRVKLVLQVQGNFNLSMRVVVDGVPKTGSVISMAAGGAVLGAFVLGVDVLGGVTYLDVGVDLNYYGKRISLEFYNNGTSQDFFVSSVMIDYRELGKAP